MDEKDMGMRIALAAILLKKGDEDNARFEVNRLRSEDPKALRAVVARTKANLGAILDNDAAKMRVFTAILDNVVK